MTSDLLSFLEAQGRKREMSSGLKDTQDSPTQEIRESLSTLKLLPEVTRNPG